MSNLFNIVNLEQGTEDWLKWRRSGFTSTDAEVLLGVSLHLTPADLLLNKKSNDFAPITDNIFIEHGSMTEPIARAFFEKSTGITFTPLCVEHPELSHIKSSLDGWSFDLNVGLEIKCPYFFGSFKKQKEDVPEYYYTQAQHHMFATQTDRWLFYSYYGNSENLRVIERDDSLIEELGKRINIFSDYLLSGKKLPKKYFKKYEIS